jgi:hypothetical protein
MTHLSSLFLMFALQANPPFTRANAFFEVKQPFFACADGPALGSCGSSHRRLQPVRANRRVIGNPAVC